MNNNKENPLKVYAIVSHIGFLIIIPLIVFIWGGSVLIEKLSLPSWTMIIAVVAGIITMVSGTANYLSKIIKLYDKDDRQKNHYISDRRDNDYYDDSIKHRKL